MVKLAQYEVVPFGPAIMHALAGAAVALAAASVLAITVPFSGWAADRPVTVWFPNVVAHFYGLWAQDLNFVRMHYDIRDVSDHYDIRDAFDQRRWAVLLAATLSGIVCFFFKRADTSIRDNRVHYDGRELIGGKFAHQAATGDLCEKTGRNEKDVPLLAPGVVWPRNWQVLNLLIVGAIGSGKTRIILFLLEQLIGRLKRNPRTDAGLFVYDTTGEITAGLPLDDNEFASITAEVGSPYGWGMSGDVRSKNDCESAAYQRAELIRESGIWPKGAMLMDAGSMIIANAEHTNWSAPQLYEICLRDPVELKIQWETLYPPAAKLIEFDAATGELSKTSSSFIMTWRANVLRTLRPLAEAWSDIPPARMFSFSRWLGEPDGRQPRVVVVQRSGRYPDISADWISMAMDSIAAHVGDPALPVSQTRTRTFVIDEAPTLGRLRRWSDMLDTGRNKGVSTIAVSQDLNQWQTAYKEVARSILSRFRLKIVCEQTPGPDAEEAAKTLIGTNRVVDWTLHRASKTPPKDPPKPEVAAIIPAEHLSDRLGVSGGVVHAVLVGLPNVYRLTWPITVWKARRIRRTP